MKTFSEWEKLFATQNIYDFNNDVSGITWLKLKSIIRKDILQKFLDDNDIALKSNSLKERFKELYDLYTKGSISNSEIDVFLKSYNADEIHSNERLFSKIEAELYKLKEFSWGGDVSNSLDKQIVSIVKETHIYDEICKHIETDISQNTYNYTLSTWFNHWTTILTEHIFKINANVVSAIGKIKSVDFFINDVPMDLKITYFPKEYLKAQRKFRGFGNEISILKKIAKEKQIIFDKNEKEEILKYQIIEQLKDSNDITSKKLLKQIEKENNSIIDETVSNKNDLIKWLYENQGEMRFGSENRLFLILIDKSDLTHSWKLKRNFKLQKKYINDYLDNFSADKIKKNKINFRYKGIEYKTLSDAIFIVVE